MQHLSELDEFVCSSLQSNGHKLESPIILFCRCVALVRYAEHSRAALCHTTVLVMCHVASDSPRNYSWEAAANKMSRMSVLHLRIVHCSKTRDVFGNRFFLIEKCIVHISTASANHPQNEPPSLPWRNTIERHTILCKKLLSPEEFTQHPNTRRLHVRPCQHFCIRFEKAFPSTKIKCGRACSVHVWQYK